MPIYEFYCVDCHMVFNFLSKTINTTKRPSCPRCGRPELERRVSRFAIGRRSGPSKESESESELDSESDQLPPGFDESKLEAAMETLAQETENVDENDPRQVARVMRKLYETAGLPVGEKMEEAIRRLEAGEDPDRIEEEMGDLLDEEDPFSATPRPKGRLRDLPRRLKPPQVDETLYDL